MKKLILLLVLAGLAVFVLTFSADRYKDRIETAASEAVGEKVVIGGGLRLSLAGVRPALAAHDVVIGTAGKDLVIEIGTLNISLSSLLGRAPREVFVKADKLQVDGRMLGTYESPVLLDGDGFDATDIKGKYGDADVTGKASYKKDKLHVEARAKGLNYSALMAGLTGDDVTLHFTADARGKTGAQLTANLNGQLAVVGGKGRMSGRAVNFWGGELLFAFLKARAEDTKINCMIGDFAIRNGVMQARHAVLDTNAVAIFGTGNVDLVNESMHMRFTPKPKERAILNIATPMLAHGPLDNIKVDPDPKGMAETVGKFLLSAVNPAMAVVPFVLQETSGNECAAYLKKDN